MCVYTLYSLYSLYKPLNSCLPVYRVRIVDCLQSIQTPYTWEIPERVLDLGRVPQYLTTQLPNPLFQKAPKHDLTPISDMAILLR